MLKLAIHEAHEQNIKEYNKFYKYRHTSQKYKYIRVYEIIYKHKVLLIQWLLKFVFSFFG